MPDLYSQPSYTKMGNILLICFLFLSTYTYSQSVQGGLILGLNASQVDGDGIGGYNKLGFNTGLVATLPLQNNFSFNLELLYSQKGSRQSANPNAPSLSSYKLKLDYLDVPIYYSYDLDDKFNLRTGIALGALIGNREFVNEVEQLVIDPPFRKYDLNWIGGLRYQLTDHFYGNVRFAYTIIPIRIVVLGGRKRGQVNKLISFRVMYMFKR